MKLRIGDDGYGHGRTMFVEEVAVTTKQGDTVVFPCRCWLGRDETNGVIVRELIPGEPVSAEPEGKNHYLTNNSTLRIGVKLPVKSPIYAQGTGFVIIPARVCPLG